MKQIARPFAIVLGVWTLIGLFWGAADYVLRHELGLTPSLWSSFRRALTEEWIWAALTPIVFWIARRFPLSGRTLPLWFIVHFASFVSLSFLHCLIAQAVGAPLPYAPPHYVGSLLKLRFLEDFYPDIWMYWPLVCIQGLIDSHARAHEREKVKAKLESELTKASLALLRAQIHPHFLFNTLHSISALIRFDTRSAEEMIADLSEILRASFSDPAAQETTLRGELELVRCYMRIQTCRFSDRLSVSYHIAPDTLDAAVPVLVLQSLVENAVIHGIAPAERPGKVEISSQRRDQQLLLTVVDDGTGLSPSYTAGVGLSNARRRLAQLYGRQQSLDLTGQFGRGAAAMVSIPFRLLDSRRPEMQAQ